MNAPHQHSRVTYAELFFDLVFVFAVTQISHTLLEHFTPLGVLQTTLLFLAVWWVWVFTSWITNWLNPEMTAVRILLFGLMLGGLVISTSIPQAFEIAGTVVRRGLCGDAGRQDRVPVDVDAAFTAGGAHECDSYYGMAVDVGGILDRRRLCGRAVTAAAVGRGARRSNTVRRRRGSGLPKYGASQVADWVVEGGHMAERFALFVIIALGKSIVVTGATFAELTWTTETVGAFSSSFVGAWRCGGSISTRARKPAPNRFQERASRGGWRGWPIPICTCRS